MIARLLFKKLQRYCALSTMIHLTDIRSPTHTTIRSTTIPAARRTGRQIGRLQARRGARQRRLKDISRVASHTFIVTSDKRGRIPPSGGASGDRHLAAFLARLFDRRTHCQSEKAQARNRRRSGF
jgi:hypothetical protein